jgi:hypothetical protein
MALLNNYSANMPGFNGPTGFSTNVSVEPNQGSEEQQSSHNPLTMGPQGFVNEANGRNPYNNDPSSWTHFSLHPPQQSMAPPPPPVAQPSSGPNPLASIMPFVMRGMNNPTTGISPQLPKTAGMGGGPNTSGMTSAMNQALMNQLAGGAVDMQKPATQVPPNASQIGNSPRNLQPLMGA